MPLSPHIRLPPEIRESKEVTLTCLLNFSCPGYQIRLQWSLEEPGITLTNLTTLTTKTVSTQSKLTFQPHWTHHGRNLTCQLWDHKAERIVSEETVLLDVKRECPPAPPGEGPGSCLFSPSPQSAPKVAGIYMEGRPVDTDGWERSSQGCVPPPPLWPAPLFQGAVSI